MTSYSFEILPDPTVPTGAYITEETDLEAESDNNAYTMELYDMYEVFSTKKKDFRPCRTMALAPQTPLPISPVPSTSTGHTPQYRYQASAEGQALTMELLGWILKGKLDQVTPAHIFASSLPVHKELVERLKPRCVKTASFEQASDDILDPFSVPRSATKCKPEFSLPLCEIVILLNSHRMEASVLDQGSQIVVICKDLTHEVGAQINTQHTLHMEGANGSTSCTLGCTEDLVM